jgi:hypothetical protein
MKTGNLAEGESALAVLHDGHAIEIQWLPADVPPSSFARRMAAALARPSLLVVIRPGVLVPEDVEGVEAYTESKPPSSEVGSFTAQKRFTFVCTTRQLRYDTPQSAN